MSTGSSHQRETKGSSPQQPTSSRVVVIDALPDELLLLVFALLDCRALLAVIPRVCRRWRALVVNTPRVHLDLRWVPSRSPLRATPRVAAELAQRYKHVASADLSGLNDVVVSAVVSHCPQLKSVWFGEKPCPDDPWQHMPEDALTDDGVTAISKHCPKLTHATFDQCRRLTDTAAIALASNCSLLISVKFAVRE